MKQSELFAPDCAELRRDTPEDVAHIVRRQTEAAFLNADAALPPLPDRLALACRELVETGAETCRLVALTVTAAVAADPDVPPRIIQASAGGRDFRSLYKEAIYPVLLAAASRQSAPWRPSRDPFVSNPYREPVLDAGWVTRRKGKLPGAEALLLIVDHLAATREHAAAVLAHLARHERALLDRAAVTYRIPPRLGSAVVIALLTRWLADDSGGRRHEVVSVALLRFAGPRLAEGWDSVESHHVNDPAPYDALCRCNGAARAVGEVKAQAVTVDHLRQLAIQMDAHQVRIGYLFTRTFWLPAGPPAEEIVRFARAQDALGRRIELLDVLEAVRLWLPLLDQRDDALPAFVRGLAEELDRHALAEDRRALAGLLEEL